MKSPAKLRQELTNAIRNIESLKIYLNNKSDEKIAAIGFECLKTADLLQEIVEKNKLPESYKVAVVGRFKAGKSSFVNELLEIKLAGEDTSPETAAVTIFGYGSQVEAKINLIDKTVWEEQKKLFQEDPKNIEAHRAKMWDSFSKPRKNTDGSEENFDLAKIESELVHSGVGKIIIHHDPQGGKGAEKAFRDKLKMYTSGNKPFHCLVSSIDIATPSSILKEGVDLIDTPGLGDTERFRVSLTEKSVENVDAILLLTKSGVAYGQEEKDFLLSILRKGSVKQLMIVITQVDQTYAQHVKASRADDELPQPIADRIKIERRRIRHEIEKTLQELSGVDSSVTRAYLEQFATVDIVFTSVQAHRDFKTGDVPGVTVSPGDPGGLIAFKDSLAGVLSTESRLATAASQILGQSKGALDALAETLEAKVVAIRNTRNSEEVERRLNSFRTQFEEICKGIEAELSETFLTFKQSTELRLQLQVGTIENMALKAERELNKFRTNDVGKHWRTRRSSNWGYMHELQSKVANRIFPLVQEMLESHIEDFSGYVRRHERKISKLTKAADAVATELELGQFSSFDIKKKLKESTSKILERTQEQITTEQEKIIKLLDSFVTEEVENKISEKRAVVADIWGRGTSYAQQVEVNSFYDSIEGILSEALSGHISSRNDSFANGLIKVAEHAPRETFQEIEAQLGNAIENLRLAADMNLTGQKEQAEMVLLDVVSKVRETSSINQKLLVHLAVEPSCPDDDFPVSEIITEVGEIEDAESEGGIMEWNEKLLSECKNILYTFNLRDGETGWPFSRILDSKIFSQSQIIRIVEPYLFKHHQLKNLKELLLHIVESSKPKTIEVLTRIPPLDRLELQEKFLDDLCKDIFKEYGVSLEISKSENIHDRYVFSDAGYVAKLGRGLDIYKPSTGLASHRQESRKVRACDITVLCR